MFSVAIFLLLAFVIQYASSENYTYVKLKVSIIECTDFPNDGACPKDHRIPDYSKSASYAGFAYNKTLVNVTLTTIFAFFDHYGANETCKKSYRANLCHQLFPACEDNDDFFYVNGWKTLQSCKQVMKDCGDLPSNILIPTLNNCNITAVKIPKRNISCQAYSDIKNDPYPCSKGNHKGPSSLVSNERNNQVLNLHNTLKKYESKLDNKCVNDVAKVICEAESPACTRDEKYIVDLVSKQDCQRIMGCLNVTKDANFINDTFKVCGHLADATTAKTIPLSDVYSTSVQPTVQPSSKYTGIYVSTKPTPSASTKPKPNISTKPIASASTKPKPNISTKPTASASTKPKPNISTKPTASASTKPKPSTSTKPAANVSTKPKPNVSTKPNPNVSTENKPKLKASVSPTDDTTIPGASIAMMVFAFLYFMQYLHYI